jgi:uncharacterized membrane protein YoaK (UPF0700 family)
MGLSPVRLLGSDASALGIQNGALHKTNGISVHSTYMTGMVTTLMQKCFDILSSKRSPKEDSSRDSARLTIQVLAPMWISFIFGAVTGAVIVSSFHSIGRGQSKLRAENRVPLRASLPDGQRLGCS